MTKKYFASNFFSNIKSLTSAFQRHQLELLGVSESEATPETKLGTKKTQTRWVLVPLKKTVAMSIQALYPAGTRTSDHFYEQHFVTISGIPLVLAPPLQIFGH